MGRMKDKAIDKLNSQKPEYIIIGSNNFWYASGLTSLKEAKETIKNIKNKTYTYANPETGQEVEDLPECFYIYRGHEVDCIYN